MSEFSYLPTESFKDSCVLCGQVLGGEVIQKDGYSVYKVPGSFWYNRNFIDTEDLQKADEITAQTLKDIPQGNPFLICFTKYDENMVIDEIIQKAGYKFITNQTGMAMKLDKDLEDVNDSSIVIIGQDRAEEYSEVISTAFQKPEDFQAIKALIVSNEAKAYAYMDNQKIIGTAIVFTKNKNAGLHEVSVLPEYRGKKIAKKLINKILYDAKKEGALYSSLQASVLGEPLYKSIGFETVSIIPTYICPPPQ